MSREVLGTLDADDAGGGPRNARETSRGSAALPAGAPADTLRLDGEPSTSTSTPPAKPDPGPDPDPEPTTWSRLRRLTAGLAVPAGNDTPARATAEDTGEGLVTGVRQLAGSDRWRRPLLALVAIAAVLGGLVGAAVAQRAALVGRERVATASAWLSYDLDSSGLGSAALFVVNSGSAAFTVTSVDLQGGIGPGASPVDLELESEIRVDPDSTARTSVRATSDCEAGPLSRGGSRDGDLRITVAGPDLREQVLTMRGLGGMSLTAVDLYDGVCNPGAGFLPVNADLSSRADGRLNLRVQSADGDDHEVDLTVPDGVTLTADPGLPILLVGDQAQSVALGLTVEVCTQNTRQLLAGQQVVIAVDGEPVEFLLDQVVVAAWFAREIERACGD